MKEEIAPQQPQAEKTDNELIAEFMGCSRPSNPDFDYFWNGEFFKEYKARWATSWDWLMPVVEKIKTQWINFNIKDVRKDIEVIRRYNKVMSMSIFSTINEVYFEVVEFIKWFNLQPKQL